jgi:anthranilate phosphoribosyltransferase
MLKGYIKKLINRENLTTKEAEAAIDIILSGADSHQVAAFLVLLRTKKETVDEILGVVKCMRKRMIALNTSLPVLDIVGTGGDGANTINISTGAAILAASCGVKIAKHGNRSVSSQCGSADVLEALGVNLNLSPTKIAQCIEKIGIGFCFAPNFHPAMKIIKDVRKNLGVPTCFNILGPLLNPAQAKYLLVGVFNYELMNLMAEVILNVGIKRAMVFHGNGLDELSCVGCTKVLEVTPSGIKPLILDPKVFGFAKCTVEDLRGKTAKENAEILLDVFKGKTGSIADTLVFNAAVALYTYGTVASVEQAIPRVRNSINDGKALKLLNDFVIFSQEGGDVSIQHIVCHPRRIRGSSHYITSMCSGSRQSMPG